jgi:hypothetical protein
MASLGPAKSSDLVPDQRMERPPSSPLGSFLWLWVVKPGSPPSHLVNVTHRGLDFQFTGMHATPGSALPPPIINW